MYEYAYVAYVLAWTVVVVAAFSAMHVAGERRFAKGVIVAAIIALFAIGFSDDWNRSRPSDTSAPTCGKECKWNRG